MAPEDATAQLDYQGIAGALLSTREARERRGGFPTHGEDSWQVWEADASAAFCFESYEIYTIGSHLYTHWHLQNAETGQGIL